MFGETKLENDSPINLSLSLLDSLVRTIQLLENAKEPREVQEAVCSMRQVESAFNLSVNFSLLRTSKDCIPSIKALISKKPLTFLPTLIQIVPNTMLKCSFLIQVGYSPKIGSGLTLSDILQKEVGEEYYLSQNNVSRILAYRDNVQSPVQLKQDTLQTETEVILLNEREQFSQGRIVASRGRPNGESNEQQLEPRQDGITNTLTGVQKDNLVLITEKDNKFRFHRNDERKSGIQGLDIFKENCETMDTVDNHPKNIICISSTQQHATISEGISTPMVSAMGEGGGHVPMIVEPTHKHGDNRTYTENAPTIQGRYGTGGDNVPYVVQVNPSTESGGKQPYQQNRVYAENGIMPALHSLSEHSNVQIDKSPTLHGFEHGTNGALQNQLSKGGMIRRLTEVECERLQGYPDSWTSMGNYDGIVKKISKSQRYKLIGNAVTVDIVKLVGMKILQKHK